MAVALALKGVPIDIDCTQLICGGDFCGCAGEEHACDCDPVDGEAFASTCGSCGEDMIRIDVDTGEPVTELVK